MTPVTFPPAASVSSASAPIRPARGSAVDQPTPRRAISRPNARISASSAGIVVGLDAQ
jgi:hypothetical protein